MNSKLTGKAYGIAINGIFLAFGVMLIFGATILPGVEMTLYALSGLILGLVILETGIKSGVLHYIGVVLLSFIVVPNKLAILPYVAFFGIYGFVKYFAEKIPKAIGQMAVKVFFFLGIFSITFLGFRELFFGNIDLPNISTWLLVLAGAAVFILYDYIYTLGINFYMKRVKSNKAKFKLSGENKKDEER